MSQSFSNMPTGMSALQEEHAAFAAELFSHLAHRAGVEDSTPLSARPLAGDAVVVGRNARGGGRIYVASDRSVLYCASSITEGEAVAAFADGRRTPLAKFSPEQA